MKGDMIFFDTETTGLLQPSAVNINAQPKIIEICCFRTDENFNVKDKFSQLINPGFPIKDEITRITGITNENLKGKPSFVEVFSRLQDLFLGVENIVAHNLPFDRDILKYELMRIDALLKFPWPPNHICTVEKSFTIHGHRMSLTRLHNHAFGEGFNAHRAEDDVKALVRCFNWLLENKYV